MWCLVSLLTLVSLIEAFNTAIRRQTTLWSRRPLLPRLQPVDGTEALEFAESSSRFCRVTKRLPGAIELVLRRSIARGQRGGAFQHAGRIARAVELRVESSGQ